MRKRITPVLLCLFLFMTNVSICYAAPIFEGTYEAVIHDDANLLTDEQEQELGWEMQKINAYGHAAFVSVSENSLSAESYARSCYTTLFGTQSGTLFLIDMDNRKLWIHSDGELYKVVTTAYAETITDNVYRMASNGEYYECAKEVYREIYALLQGERIAQPMKYISNTLLAMILALLINFGLVCYFTRLRKPSEADILRIIDKHLECTKPTATFTHKTQYYDPIETDSGSSSSSGGSSGGGGSSSGGGGGHSF